MKVDPARDGRYIIAHTAAALPDVLGWANQGFTNRQAAEHRHPDLWQWERPASERVVYRMTCSL